MLKAKIIAVLIIALLSACSGPKYLDITANQFSECHKSVTVREKKRITIPVFYTCDTVNVLVEETLCFIKKRTKTCLTFYLSPESLDCQFMTVTEKEILAGNVVHAIEYYQGYMQLQSDLMEMEKKKYISKKDRNQINQELITLKLQQ